MKKRLAVYTVDLCLEMNNFEKLSALRDFFFVASNLKSIHIKFKSDQSMISGGAKRLASKRIIFCDR